MPKTVLIVEDDADTLAIFRSALDAEGYRVLSASHGAEGVHLARNGRPDLILLDIRMPVMDGWTAIKYLKSYAETRNIPVCAISAFDSANGQIEGVLFDCFLTKPIDPRAIVSVVAEHIGPGGNHDKASA